jgi:hypothetical protein
VDDGLVEANSEQEAIELQKQLQSLFSRGFLLQKWNSSESTVLKHLPGDLKDHQLNQMLPQSGEYSRTWGVEWNASMDHLRLTIIDSTPLTNDSLTLRALGPGGNRCMCTSIQNAIDLHTRSLVIQETLFAILLVLLLKYI